MASQFGYASGPTLCRRGIVLRRSSAWSAASSGTAADERTGEISLIDARGSADDGPSVGGTITPGTEVVRHPSLHRYAGGLPPRHRDRVSRPPHHLVGDQPAPENHEHTGF